MTRDGRKITAKSTLRDYFQPYFPLYFLPGKEENFTFWVDLFQRNSDEQFDFKIISGNNTWVDELLKSFLDGGRRVEKVILLS